MRSNSVVSFLFSRLALLILFFIPLGVHAYPEYVRLNYVSCNACHQSIHGGGVLTPYGQSIGMSEAIFKRDVEESEEEGIQMTHGFHGRIIAMKINGSSDIFPMQADYLNHTQWSEPFSSQLSLGVDRVRATGKSTAVVRKASISYRLNDESLLTVGREHLPEGIYQDDHTLLIRSQNRRNVNDFYTTLRLDYQTEEGLLSPYVIAPSFEERSANQEYGFGFKSEYNLKDNWVIGSTVVFAGSSSIRRTLLGAYTRMGITTELGLLFEYLWTYRNLKSTPSDSFSQNVIHFKPFWNFTEFVEFGTQIEYFHRAAPFFDQAVNWGPSLRMRIMREMSLIFDFRWTVRQQSTQEFFGSQLFVHL